MLSQGIDCLIVDDHEDICDILEFYMERTGLFRSIQKCFDGKEAILKLSRQEYGLVLLDCNLPYLSGAEVVDNLGLTDSRNVIIISGDLDEKSVKDFVNHGIRNFLIKPFDEASIVAKMSNVLRQEIQLF